MLLRATGIKTAGVAYASTVGTAIQTYETTTVTAREHYLSTLMTVSETAAAATLRADRDKEIALADADLQKQLTGNESAHTTAVNNANSAHSTATANAETARKSAEQAALTQLNSTLAQATKDKEASIAGAERTYDQAVASLDAQYGSESSKGDTGVEGATRRSAIKTRDAQYYAARDTSWANTLSGSTTLGTTPWTAKAITAANGQAAHSVSRANAQAAHDAAMLDAIEDWQLSSRESLTDLLFTEGQSRETYNVATSNVYANWENGVGNLLGDKPEGTGWFVSGNSDEASSPSSPNVHEPKLRTHDDLVTTDEESQPQDDELDRPEINESELSAELKDAISEYNKVFAEGLQGAGNRKITTEELKALVRGIPGLQVYWGTDIVIVTIDEHQFVFVYESRTEMLDGPALVYGEHSYEPTRTDWFWSYKGMLTGYTTSSIVWNHESDKSMPWIKGQEIVLETTLHLLPGGTLADKLVNETDENVYYVALTTAGDLTLIGGLYFKATTRLGKAVLLADVAVNGVGAGAAAYQYANSEEGRAAHAGEFVLRLAAMGLGANSLRLSNAKAKIGKVASEAQAIEKVAENAPSRVVQSAAESVWRVPGARVRQRAAALLDELGLAKNGVTSTDGVVVRKLDANELMALSENFGREYSLIQKADGSWILRSGQVDRVPIEVGSDIHRIIHTHAGNDATPSPADLAALYQHIKSGGRGTLEIAVREPVTGRAAIRTMSRAEVEEWFLFGVFNKIWDVNGNLL